MVVGCFDASADESVLAVVESFTPAVEVLRPGVCAFATRGPSRYFGGDEKLAARIVSALSAHLLRVGVADGRFAAERAADMAGRDTSGVHVVAPGESRPFLAPLPVRCLIAAGEIRSRERLLGDVDSSLNDFVSLLIRLGIRTLGDLAALPVASVAARFGSAGAFAHRLAQGFDPRPSAVRVRPPDLAVTAELDPAIDSLETLAFVARGLADRLHQDLARRGMAATRVLVEAETENGERLSRSWRHDQGLSASALAERVRWQLDGWLSNRDQPADQPGDQPADQPAGGRISGGGLALLRLTPDEVGPDHGRQQDFWAVERPAAAARAARSVARVQGLLGPEAVVTAEVVGARGPGEQMAMIPWGESRTVPTRGRPIRPPWPGRIPPPAPATVHPEPLPSEMFDVEGARVTVSGRGVMSGAPHRLSIHGLSARGSSVEVQQWAGPWPADERWWEIDGSRRRARGQVLTDDGVAYLLVLEGGRWWVEATYD